MKKTYRLAGVLLAAMLLSGAAVADDSEPCIMRFAFVKAPEAQLRSEASDQNQIVGSLFRGQSALVVFGDGDWYKVRHPRFGEAWAHRSQVSLRWQLVQGVNFAARQLTLDMP
jgi:hypothetical protein